MEILKYLTPDNEVGLRVVYFLVGLFGVWLVLLIWDVWRNLTYRSQINSCAAADALPVSGERSAGDTILDVVPSRQERDGVFSAFLESKKLKADSPVAKHLRAIFDAGWNESQLDAGVLLKSTAGEIFRTHSLHRTLLSVFIIVGLLGTLFGIADTLSSLSSLLGGGTQLNNETLNEGLKGLLGTLEGAFAPSIWGVSMTVLGVLLFALYLRFVAAPLSGLLEHTTLTVWIPQLMPTASQKLLDKLQLSERQMQRSFAAAQKVAEFAENIQHKAGTFSETLGLTTEALRTTGNIAERLGTFSENFVEGVRALAPFQQDLRSLYQQMVNESRAFQESVERNIAGAEEFQRRVQAQLQSQHEQTAQVLSALRSYESAYVASRGRIDEQLEKVLTQAEQAFQGLSRRNEEVAGAIDAALGQPLRANLAQHLGAVEAALQSRLGGIGDALQAHLATLSERIRELDAPLNNAAGRFTDTFYNFNEHTEEWRATLQREFAAQNETNRQQLQRLDALSRQVPELLQRLTESSQNFSDTSGSFAAQGRRLSEDVSALTQKIADLGRSVDALGGRVTPPDNGADPRLADLIAKQTGLMETIAAKIERLSVRPQQVPVPVTPDGDSRRGFVVPPKLSWRDRIRGWFSSDGT